MMKLHSVLFLIILFLYGEIVFGQNNNTQAIDTSQPSLENKGVGPVSLLRPDSKIDKEMAAKGEVIYNNYCFACHKIKGESVGPELGGITKLRAPEWLMNMILAPEEMNAKDPIAMQLVVEYNSEMTTLGLSEKEAREVLEYLRTLE